MMFHAITVSSLWFIFYYTFLERAIIQLLLRSLAAALSVPNGCRPNPAIPFRSRRERSFSIFLWAIASKSRPISAARFATYHKTSPSSFDSSSRLSCVKTLPLSRMIFFIFRHFVRSRPPNQALDKQNFCRNPGK